MNEKKGFCFDRKMKSCFSSEPPPPPVLKRTGPPDLIQDQGSPPVSAQCRPLALGAGAVAPVWSAVLEPQ